MEDMIEGTQIASGIFKSVDTGDITTMDEKGNEFFLVPLFQISQSASLNLKPLFTHYQTSYNAILIDSRFLNGLKGHTYYLADTMAKKEKRLVCDKEDRFQLINESELGGEGSPSEQIEEEIVPSFVRNLEDMIMKTVTMCKVFDEHEILIIIERTTAKLREISLGMKSSMFEWLPYKIGYCLAAQTYKQLLNCSITSLQPQVDLLVSQIDDIEYKLRDVKLADKDKAV